MSRLFIESLFGGMHAFDSTFPTATGPASSANSFSLQVGKRAATPEAQNACQKEQAFTVLHYRGTGGTTCKCAGRTPRCLIRFVPQHLLPPRRIFDPGEKVGNQAALSEGNPISRPRWGPSNPRNRRGCPDLIGTGEGSVRPNHMSAASSLCTTNDEFLCSLR